MEHGRAEGERAKAGKAEPASAETTTAATAATATAAARKRDNAGNHWIEGRHLGELGASLVGSDGATAPTDGGTTEGETAESGSAENCQWRANLDGERR